MITIDDIKVEISLGDLTKLKTMACYYGEALEQRDKYFTELEALRKELAELKETTK